jgi:acyl-CoA synthetase (NDP forming)
MTTPERMLGGGLLNGLVASVGEAANALLRRCINALLGFDEVFPAALERCGVLSSYGLAKSFKRIWKLTDRDRQRVAYM